MREPATLTPQIEAASSRTPDPGTISILVGFLIHISLDG